MTLLTVAIYNQVECVGGHPFVLCERHRVKFHPLAEAACILIDLPQKAKGECVMCEKEKP